MERVYSTPRQLVEALQQLAPDARPQLWQQLRGPLGGLMDQVKVRHQLTQDRDRLILHALHAVETYLRTQPATAFASMTWAGFRGTALLYLAKLVFHPFARQAGDRTGPVPLPEAPGYSSQTFFLPHDRIGGHWFGGDWFAGAHHQDGSLWVLVADVTGHGYYAYLLAGALPAVWQKCWAGLGTAATQPSDLLAAMHELLASCLPEGVYVECTLVRLGPEGKATVAPAGGSRLLLRRGNRAQADLLKLRGTWLGLSAPMVEDQRTLALAGGDEILIATDGVFDQLADHSAVTVWDLNGAAPGDASLFDAVHGLLHEALARKPQKDDITMVLLRRRPVPTKAVGVESIASAHNGAEDVPV
jgi:serine phosphatase RsbU (regulator of sigma subunit)